MSQDPRPVSAGSHPAPSYGCNAIHSMLPRGGNLSPKAASAIIRSRTEEGDIVLDPSCGYGTAAVEALKAGRRAIIVGSNPMAAFIARTVLEPVVLPRVRWALEDIRDACRTSLSDLYRTKCPSCGRYGIIEYVLREEDTPLKLAYSCACTGGRLEKRSDPEDRKIDGWSSEMEIPHWYPARIPASSAVDPPWETDAMFSRRALAALSMILHAVENVADTKVRNAMKLAFAGSLGDCSRAGLPPFPVAGAARYTVPRRWREVNPWQAFEASFSRVYEGKRECNGALPNASPGYRYKEMESGGANALVLCYADEKGWDALLPKNIADCVLTSLPADPNSPYPSPYEFWGAWLRMDFDARRAPSADPESLRRFFRQIARTAKDGAPVGLFLDDRPGQHLHATIRAMRESGIIPDRIRHRPSLGTPKRGADSGRKPAGSYLLLASVTRRAPGSAVSIPGKQLSRKLASVFRIHLVVRGAQATVESALRAIYPRLEREEIAAIAEHPADEWLLRAARSSAEYRAGRFRPRRGVITPAVRRKLAAVIRRAILDAASIFSADDPTEEILAQAVLNLSAEGIPPEDVSASLERISKADIDRHRRKRFTELLRLFGEGLGCRSRAVVKPRPAVFWMNSDSLQAEFELREKVVRVCTTVNGKAASVWGTVSYPLLERQLRLWCKRNPARGRKLLARLNPVDEDFANREREIPAAGSASNIADLPLKVVENSEVCPQHYRIRLELPEDCRLDFVPGQFFHVLCDPDNPDGSGDPLALRRPLSVHGAEYSGFRRDALAKIGILPAEIREALIRRPSRIDFLYRVVGEGTKRLSQLLAGALLDAIGPCGNGFIVGPEPAAVIVAGGIGIAPLAILAERLRFLGKDVYLYFGAVAKDMLALALHRPDSPSGAGDAAEQRDLFDAIRSEFREIGAEVLGVCTDDGSAGEKGLVTDLLEQGIRGGCVPREGARLYACGPEGMLKTVAEIAARYSLDCEVSLEERMACGIGACYSCTCWAAGADGKSVKKRVCRDGPVFRAGDIQWKV